MGGSRLACLTAVGFDEVEEFLLDAFSFGILRCFPMLDFSCTLPQPQMLFLPLQEITEGWGSN